MTETKTKKKAKKKALSKVLKEVQKNASEPKKEAPAEAPKPAKKAKPAPQPRLKHVVSLDVFFRVKNILLSAQGGFRAEARRLGLTKLTIPEWSAELEKFMKRPMR